MATINLGKVITDQQKAVLDRVSYDSTDNQLETSVNLAPTTLKQQNANYTKDFALVAGSGSCSIENIYCRFIEINNVLHCIANIKLTNSSNNTINISTLAYVALYIDTHIASKLIDLHGNSVAESADEENVIVSLEPATITRSDKSGAGFNPQTCYLTVDNRTVAGNARVALISNELVSIEPNESIWVMGRIALTLI